MILIYIYDEMCHNYCLFYCSFAFTLRICRDMTRLIFLFLFQIVCCGLGAPVGKTLPANCGHAFSC